MSTTATEQIDFVFDGPPGPEGAVFVETEDDAGRGIGIGEWRQREDGYWALRITVDASTIRRAEA